MSRIGKTPYVCKVCGQDITIGRHKSGWRHVSENRPDHRVQKVSREDYVAALTRHGIVFVFAQDDLGLDVFPSEEAAIADCEGVDVEDGNYLFWDSAGRPLQPVFTIPNRRGSFTVVSGEYRLEPAPSGELLIDVLKRAAYMEANHAFASLDEVEAFLSSL